LELEATAEEQVQLLHHKVWEKSQARPFPASTTELLWQPDYPVWLGADRKLSRKPLPFPGKIQVTGHVTMHLPDANATRIRLDTSGGFGRLTACLLRSPCAAPQFFSSR
jgi:serine/threonine protein phosphatase 1